MRQKIQYLQFFFADSKSRKQELSNDVSFVIFGHQTWDLEGGGANWPPPPSISWFSITPAEIGLRIKDITGLGSLLEGHLTYR